MTYRELYNAAENPLNNSKQFNQFLETLMVEKSEYEALVKNYIQEETKYNDNDRDEFYRIIYQKWRKGVLELSDEKIEELIKSGKIKENFKNFRDKILKYPEINTYKDYINLINKIYKSESMIEAYKKYPMIHENTFHHINSEYYDYDEKHKKISHRLYINMDSLNGFKFITEFIKKCDKRNIPYYFKFDFFSSRDDKLVIYSSTKHITDYIEILREIKKENEDLVKNVKNPPILTSPIDGWIGYGTEPKIKHTSYNKIRAEIIEKAVNEEVNKWFEENKNKKYITGKYDSFAERLAEINAEDFIKLHNKKNILMEESLLKKGIDKKILNSIEMKNSLFKQYTEIIKKVLNDETNYNRKIYYKDTYLERAIINKGTILYNILRIAYENDKENIVERIKENITSKCRENGISPSKFCMDIEVIKEMMAYSKMKYGDDLKDITVVKKKEKEKKKKDTKDILDDIWDKADTKTDTKSRLDDIWDKTDVKKDTKTTLEEMWDKVDTKTDTKSKLDDLWDKVDTKTDNKKETEVEDDIVKLVVDSEKEKVFDDSNKDEDKASKEALQDYKNSGYGKNVYGWYYNPNIDEYDKDYDPTKDPFFNKELMKKSQINKKEIKKQSELKNIIVYTAINRRNEIKNRAFLIYDDGTIKNVDEERFTKEIAQIAKDKNVSNYNQLESMGILEFTTVKELVKDWNNYFYDSKDDVVSRHKSA